MKILTESAVLEVQEALQKQLDCLKHCKQNKLVPGEGILISLDNVISTVKSQTSEVYNLNIKHLMEEVTNSEEWNEMEPDKHGCRFILYAFTEDTAAKIAQVFNMDEVPTLEKAKEILNSNVYTSIMEMGEGIDYQVPSLSRLRIGDNTVVIYLHGDVISPLNLTIDLESPCFYITLAITGFDEEHDLDLRMSLYVYEQGERLMLNTLIDKVQDSTSIVLDFDLIADKMETEIGTRGEDVITVKDTDPTDFDKFFVGSNGLTAQEYVDLLVNHASYITINGQTVKLMFGTVELQDEKVILYLHSHVHTEEERGYYIEGFVSGDFSNKNIDIYLQLYYLDEMDMAFPYIVVIEETDTLVDNVATYTQQLKDIKGNNINPYYVLDQVNQGFRLIFFYKKGEITAQMPYQLSMGSNDEHLYLHLMETSSHVGDTLKPSMYTWEFDKDGKLVWSFYTERPNEWTFEAGRIGQFNLASEEYVLAHAGTSYAIDLSKAEYTREDDEYGNSTYTWEAIDAEQTKEVFSSFGDLPTTTEEFMEMIKGRHVSVLLTDEEIGMYDLQLSVSSVFQERMEDYDQIQLSVHNHYYNAGEEAQSIAFDGAVMLKMEAGVVTMEAAQLRFFQAGEYADDISKVTVDGTYLKKLDGYKEVILQPNVVLIDSARKVYKTFLQFDEITFRNANWNTIVATPSGIQEMNWTDPETGMFYSFYPFTNVEDPNDIYYIEKFDKIQPFYLKNYSVEWAGAGSYRVTGVKNYVYILDVKGHDYEWEQGIADTGDVKAHLMAVNTRIDEIEDNDPWEIYEEH